MTATLGGLKYLMLALCVGMACTIVYTCSTVGSPFKSEYLTGWMPATLVDFYVNVTVLLCWVWYKEQSWAARVFWTLLLIGLGSFGTTAYVFVQLTTMEHPKSIQKLLLRKQRSNYE